MLGTILIVLLILALVGALPPVGLVSYGYGAPGLVTILLVVVIVLILTGRL